jgi:CopG family nickel-responsive transcriptional regulator
MDCTSADAVCRTVGISTTVNASFHNPFTRSPHRTDRNDNAKPGFPQARRSQAHDRGLSIACIVLLPNERAVDSDKYDVNPYSSYRSMTKGKKMQRITITLDDDLMDELDQMIIEQGYQNRSEAIRDFTRAGMQQAAQKMGKSGSCVAALVYVYDHAARDLSRRLVENYHGHHDLSMATLHVHLDDDNCMEVTALRGTGAEVQHFADHIIAERGVRYGRLVMIPTEAGKKKTVAHKKTGHRHP